MTDSPSFFNKRVYFLGIEQPRARSRRPVSKGLTETVIRLLDCTNPLIGQAQRQPPDWLKLAALMAETRGHPLLVTKTSSCEDDARMIRHQGDLAHQEQHATRYKFIMNPSPAVVLLMTFCV